MSDYENGSGHCICVLQSARSSCLRFYMNYSGRTTNTNVKEV